MGLEPEALRRGDDTPDVFARGAPVHDDQHVSAFPFPAPGPTFILHPAALPPPRLPEAPCPRVPPSSRRARRLAPSPPAAATYVIYTKDGTGSKRGTSPSSRAGASSTSPLSGRPRRSRSTSGIRSAARRRTGKASAGAYVLDDPGGRTPRCRPEAKKPSLSEYIRRNGRKTGSDRPEPPEPARDRRRAARPPRGGRRASARRPRPVVSDAFMRALDGSNVKGVKLGDISPRSASRP